MQDPTVLVPADSTSGGTGASPIVLTIPAEASNGALVRAVAGHLGARVGLTVTEITDLRLAVDEACALLIGGASGGASDGEEGADGELTCRFDHSELGLRITILATGGVAADPDTAAFGWLVLSMLVDELCWARVSGGTRMDLFKRPVERDAP